MKKIKIQKRQYQEDVIKEVEEKWISGEKEVVIGACPNSGKTHMAIRIIKAYREDQNVRILILPHGTNVIKDQWERKLKASGLNPSENPNDSVCLTLPHSLYKKKFPKFDLIIIDEGHEFVFVKDDKTEGMIKKIFKKNRSAKVLYLTGTPSKFIARNYKPVIVAAEDLIPEFSSDLYFGIATTTAPLRRYINPEGDINTNGSKMLERNTPKILDNLLDAIVKRLRSSFKRKPLIAEYTSWLNVLNKMEKTMFACNSIKQAKIVEEYFKSKNISVLNSNSETDPNSEYFEKFQNDSSIRVMVVVDRGILGFDMPYLCNVIDMTGSININRIYQLYARVMRQHPEGNKKYFFKIVPNDEQDYYKFFMTASLRLMCRDFISIYNGRNLGQCVIPVKKKKKNIIGGSCGLTKKKKYKRVTPAEEIFYGGLPVVEFMKAVFNRNDRIFNEYAHCTINDIKRLNGERVIDSEGNKKEILSKNEPPKEGNKLYTSYYGYIKPSSQTFDSKFREECVKRGWITDSSLNKKEILSKNEPPKKGDKLCGVYRTYISPSSGVFDPEFREECIKRGWINEINPSMKKKEILSKNEPPKNGDKLFNSFSSYITPSSQSFDSKFRKECIKRGWIKTKGGN